MSDQAYSPISPFTPMTGYQRSFLRAMAHAFKPVVHVGQGGATDGVLKAIQEALLTHELIKVRLQRPKDKNALSATLAAGSGSRLCGLIGHTAILYKPHPEKPRIRLPNEQA